jgi:hypothetical protein
MFGSLLAQFGFENEAVAGHIGFTVPQTSQHFAEPSVTAAQLYRSHLKRPVLGDKDYRLIVHDLNGVFLNGEWDFAFR